MKNDNIYTMETVSTSLDNDLKMKLKDVVEIIKGRLACGSDKLDSEVNYGFASSHVKRTLKQLNVDPKIITTDSQRTEFIPSNINCLTLGNITGVIILLVSGNPYINFNYNH